MSTAMIERERAHEYTKDEIKSLFRNEGIESGDATFLAAIQIDPMVFGEEGSETAHNLPTRSVNVYETETGATGYYHWLGHGRIVVLNVNDMIDYDLVSELHQQKDAHVYIWSTTPFEGEADFELINTWYRDETYPDTYKEEDNG